uniref:E3 ubiquitin-protein ligase E3D n=1 Tax=Pipistrellus kuhlii TaxID=59472 RepID=A0A7J7YPD2_PIPKU|nr:ubiquitin protein ligase E3D [Pipistrellus kuhlii]
MASPAETRVFLEVRRRLQSALLVLGEPKEGGMPMDVSITPSSLLVKTPGGCTEICLPAEVRLVPSSGRGLQYVAGDGLHLRLQARAEHSSTGSSSGCSHCRRRTGELSLENGAAIRTPLLRSHFIRERTTALLETLSSW